MSRNRAAIIPDSRRELTAAEEHRIALPCHYYLISHGRIGRREKTENRYIGGFRFSQNLPRLEDTSGLDSLSLSILDGAPKFRRLARLLRASPARIDYSV